MVSAWSSTSPVLAAPVGSVTWVEVAARRKRANVWPVFPLISASTPVHDSVTVCCAALVGTVKDTRSAVSNTPLRLKSIQPARVARWRRCC